MMMSAPPVTPPEDRLASASDATLMPTGALKVTAPRIGYITEAASVAAAVASLALDLEMHAEVGKDILRVRQHVHQMRDRRALVAGDIADAAFEQAPW